MNWTRGLWRLWLVASIAYAALAGFFAWRAMWDARLARNPFADLIPNNPITWDEGGQIALIVCLPPLLVLVLGYGAAWVVRGFRGERA